MHSASGTSEECTTRSVDTRLSRESFLFHSLSVSRYGIQRHVEKVKTLPSTLEL